jgi:hypothetical protein
MADPALTLTDVAEDESFLALVEQGLVRVAHERLLVPATEARTWTQPGLLPVETVFAGWVAIYARAYRHAAALAILTRDDAPDVPWDVEWIRAALHASWATMAHAAAACGLISVHV